MKSTVYFQYVSLHLMKNHANIHMIDFNFLIVYLTTSITIKIVIDDVCLFLFKNLIFWYYMIFGILIFI